MWYQMLGQKIIYSTIAVWDLEFTIDILLMKSMYLSLIGVNFWPNIIEFVDKYLQFHQTYFGQFTCKSSFAQNAILSRQSCALSISVLSLHWHPNLTAINASCIECLQWKRSIVQCPLGNGMESFKSNWDALVVLPPLLVLPSLGASNAYPWEQWEQRLVHTRDDARPDWADSKMKVMQKADNWT